jgi:hypothetical protein
MKRLFLSILAMTVAFFSHAQTNIFPTSGSVGIGTLLPATPLHIVKASTAFTDIPMQRWDPAVSGYNLTFSNYNGIHGIDYRFTQLSNSVAIPVLTFQSGNVGIGTYDPLLLFHVAVNASKTTASGSFVSFVSTNDASNPFGLRTVIFGSPSINDRYVGLQTTDYALANGGSLILQATGGNVGIGTTNTKGYMLAVNGSAVATSMTVKLNANWPDYVFKPDYRLPAISEVKTFIDQNQHLPEMPSEAEIAKDGQNLGEMNKLLVKKVEELTLYLIEKDQQVREQQKQISQQAEKLDQIAEQLQKLTDRINTGL